MTKGAKQIIVILIVLLLAGAFLVYTSWMQKTELEGIKTGLEKQLEQDKDKLAQSEQRQASLKVENDNLKGRVDEAEGLKEKLEADITDLQAKIRTFEDEIAQARQKVSAATQERDEAKKRFEEVRKELDEAFAKLKESSIVSVPVAETGDDEKKMEDHWAKVLKQKAEIEMRIGDLESNLNQRSLEVEELKKRNVDLELEISALRQEREDLTRQIRKGQVLAESLSLELVREKNDNKFSDEKIEKIKQENNTLRSEVKTLNAMKIALEKSITKLQEDKKVIEQKLKETETLVQGRINEVMDIKSEIDRKLSAPNPPAIKEVMLPPIIVSGGTLKAKEAAPGVTDGSAGSPASGKILNINTENNFVIVDLGESSGIKVGDTMSVYRGDAYVGDIEVIQVRNDISAADIIKQSKPLQPGDNVK